MVWLAIALAASHQDVVADVVDTESRWTEHADIETLVWLDVDGSTVEVVLPAGRIGPEFTWTSGTTWLHPGHRYALRLTEDRNGVLRVIETESLSGPTPPPPYDLSSWNWAYQADPVEEPWELNPAGWPVSTEEVEAEFIEALRTWSIQPEALLHLDYLGTTSNSQWGGGDNGHNVLMWEDYSWGSTLASTRTNGYGNEITDCDTQIYGENSYGEKLWSFDPDGADGDWYDFRHTAIHELGHCLGLGHSAVDDAIMGPTNGPGTGDERRNLHADDIAAIQVVYGVATVELDLDITAGDVSEGVIELDVSVANIGVGRAWDVVVELATDLGELSTDHVDAGTLNTDDDAGETVTLTVPADCTPDDEVLVTALAYDAVDRSAEAELTIALSCPSLDDDPDGAGDDPDGGDEPVGGCGCASVQGWPLWWSLALVPALLRRKAKAETP